VELVIVIVAAPGVVTMPIHMAPRCVAGGVVNWTDGMLLTQVVTPPPDTADTLGAPPLVLTMGAQTSRLPRVTGVTDKVEIPLETPVELRVPTAEIVASPMD